MSYYRSLLIIQPGAYDLAGIIVYEIDQQPYQSTFYNGTIEVAEVGGLLSVESVFLFCLGVALLGLLGVWIRGQIQQLSKVITHLSYTSFIMLQKLQNVYKLTSYFYFSRKYQ